MDQSVEQIEAHIGQVRQRLGVNLRELHDTVDTATDWREQLRARPWLMMGAACLGGIALAATLRSRKSEADLDAPPRRSTTVHDVVGWWDDVVSALVGVASSEVSTYIGRVVPGFDEHYEQAARRNSRS